MAWIRIIQPDESEPGSHLERLYRACIDEASGEIDNIIKIHGLRPDTMRAHLDLYKTAMFPRGDEGLSRREREMIAVAVSRANGCHY